MNCIHDIWGLTLFKRINVGEKQQNMSMKKIKYPSDVHAVQATIHECFRIKVGAWLYFIDDCICRILYCYVKADI